MSYTNTWVLVVYLGLGTKSYCSMIGTWSSSSANTTNLSLLTNMFLGLPSSSVSERIFAFSAGKALTIISLFCVSV